MMKFFNSINTDKRKDLLATSTIILVAFFIIILICMIESIKKGDFSNFFGCLKVYDAYYYENIAENGYGTSGDYIQTSPDVQGMFNGMATWAFFPLMPMLVGLLHFVTFGLIDYFALGVMCSFVFMFFALYNLIKFLRKKGITINYLIIAILFVFNSYFIIYFNFYTEALFMMILTLFLNYCEDKKFVLAGIMLGILTAVRITGVFFVIYLFVKIYQEVNGENKFTIKTFFKNIWSIIKQPKYLFSLAISVFGLGCFVVILRYVYGLSPLAFMDVQMAWGKEYGFLILNIIEGFAYNNNKFINAIFCIIAIGFCIYLMIAKKRFLNSSIILLFIVFSSSTSLNSIDRYVLGMLLLTIELYEICVRNIEMKAISSPTKFKKSLAIVVLIVFITFMIVGTDSIIHDYALFY